MSEHLERLLQAMFDTTAIGVTVAAADGRWVRGNPAFVRMIGYPAEELVGKTFLELTHEADREENARLYRELWEGRRSTYTMEKRFVHRTGTPVWTRVTASLSTDRQFAVAMVEDISHLRAEREERERLEFDLGKRMKELTALHGVARVLADRTRTSESLLEGIAALLPPAFQFPEHASARVRLGNVERATKGFHEAADEAKAEFSMGSGEPGEIAVRYQAPPRTAGQPLFLTEEQILLDSVADMVRVELERRRADAATARSTERLELALTSAQMGLWEWDVATNRTYGSESVGAFIGSSGPVEGPMGSLSPWVHPDDKEALYAQLRRLATEPWREPEDLEVRLARPEGGWRALKVRAFVTRDATGRAARVLAVMADVSVQRALREQLAQTQRHDALGLVTGSVAHDFNNVLAAVLSGVQILLLDLRPGPAADAAATILQASRRGAALTREMVGFSRKSDFRRTQIDVATIVERNRPMLERLLGTGVKVVTSLGAGCHAVGSAEQLEQVLLIFALNSLEALGGTGKVSVSVRVVDRVPDAAKAADVRPGPLVELTFSDTGPGMRPEVAARVFEPWFTTRQARGAAGLGLSLAMNIAHQHEGHLTVESRAGEGATFRLYLPRDK